MRGTSTAVDLVIVCPHLGDGGVQRVVTTLANTWAERDIRVCCMTLYNKEDSFALAAGIHRKAVPHGPALLESGWATLKRLKQRLKSSRSPSPSESRSAFPAWVNRRFVQFFLWYQVAMLKTAIRRSGAPVVLAFCGSTNIITLQACRRLPVRVVISERNDPAIQQLKEPWQALRPQWYNRADVVTANSRGALTSMAAYVDSGKLLYVPNPLLGTRNGDPSRAPRAEDRSCAVLIVGRLEHQKAHDVLLEAFARLASDPGACRLHVVGRGPLEKPLRRQAETLNLSGRIDWHGHVTDPYPFYYAADIFVLPSRHEGMPNALLEAMSCGLPSIVSDASPGPLEMIEHEVTGLVVPVDDPQALAQAIERLAADPALRTRLGNAARERVATYELEHVLPIWEQVLNLKS